VGTVDTVEATRATAKRLADMGFVRGATVEMLRPGKPCLVRIGRTCVGLGLEHQGSILLRTLEKNIEQVVARVGNP